MAKAPIIDTAEDFNKFMEENANKMAMVMFMEEWSTVSLEALDAVEEMLSDPEMPTDISLVRIHAETTPEICQKHGVNAVPTTLLFQNGKEVFRMSGARVRDLAAKLMSHLSLEDPISAPPPPVQQDGSMDLNQKIKKLLSQADVMLFMKGSPEEPQCGFSRTIVGVLNETGVPYSTFNILADNDIREGLKVFSNWRTYPQLYVKGELIGGLDIVKELKENGELMTTLKP